MILRPKKTKFKKSFKGRIRGKAKRGFSLEFGSYGLKALTSERIRENQIEAARKAINRYLKRSGKLWIRIFPDLAITKKPTDVRMGKGKGPLDCYISKVKPGRIIFELDSVTEKQAQSAFALATAKLPLRTKFVKLLSGASL